MLGRTVEAAEGTPWVAKGPQFVLNTGMVNGRVGKGVGSTRCFLVLTSLFLFFWST